MAELGIGRAVMNKQKEKKLGDEIDGFTFLSMNSWILRPKVSTDSAERPPLVILCSWMGARPRNVAKYVEAYKQRFPNVGILLISCEVADMMTRSRDTQQRSFVPVRGILRSAMNLFGEEESTSPTILHVFSHGGCNSAIQLLTSFQKFGTTPPLPFNALVLDSCPGGPSIERTIKAMSVSLPKTGIKRFFLLAGMYFAVYFMYLMVFLRLRRGTAYMRKEMLDPNLFPKSTKRLYLYSKGDEIVDYLEVRRHAEEAEAAGYSVEQVLFEKSPHCAHIREDEELYWSSIQNLFKSTLSK